MTAEVFQTEAWFANLLAHGLSGRRMRSRPGRWCRRRTGSRFAADAAAARGPCWVWSYYSCSGGLVALARRCRLVCCPMARGAAGCWRRWPDAGVALQPLDADSARFCRVATGLARQGTGRTDFCFGNRFARCRGRFWGLLAQRLSMLAARTERDGSCLDRGRCVAIEIRRTMTRRA